MNMSRTIASRALVGQVVKLRQLCELFVHLVHQILEMWQSWSVNVAFLIIVCHRQSQAHPLSTTLHCVGPPTMGWMVGDAASPDWCCLCLCDCICVCVCVCVCLCLCLCTCLFHRLTMGWMVGDAAASCWCTAWCISCTRGSAGESKKYNFWFNEKVQVASD